MIVLLIFIVVLLATILIGVPIAFGLLLSGVAMMWYLGALDWQSIALQMTNGADSFPLLAIPFFLLAGEAMNAGGCRAVSSISAWRWSDICAAVSAMSPSSPQSCWPVFRVRRLPIPPCSRAC
jgi:hypothetical protein